MAKIYAFMAPGMEEVECLAVADVLIRGGMEVNLVSITDSLEVTSSHQVTVKADCLLKDVDWEGADAFFLPGGLPGTTNLGAARLCATAFWRRSRRARDWLPSAPARRFRASWESSRERQPPVSRDLRTS